MLILKLLTTVVVSHVSSLNIVLSPDTHGLVAEISISANDGIRGVIEWTDTT